MEARRKEKVAIDEKLTALQEQIDKEHMLYCVYRCQDLNEMIAVLKPLTSKKTQSKLSCLTPSEANQKLRTLEQDLHLVKDELAELESKYGRLESYAIEIVTEAKAESSEESEHEQIQDKQEPPSDEEEVEFVAEESSQNKRSRETLAQMISEHRNDLE